MAKLLDCEPVGSREVIDPSLVVAVTLDDNVTLSEGGTTTPALAGTWSTITNQYVTGIQFEYGPSDLSSGITLTTANKAALSWVHSAGLLPVKSYTIRYRAIGAAPNTFGPWAGPFTRTSGTGVASDVVPVIPATVVGVPALSISTSIGADGTEVSRMTTSCDPVANATGYDVDIDDGVITWTEWSPTSSLKNKIVAAGRSYRTRFKAMSRTGHRSAAWSSWSAIVAAGGDTTAPGVLTGGSVTALARRLILQWVSPTDDDYAGLQIYRGSTEPAGGATPTFGATAPITGTVFSDTNVLAGTVYNYWGRSVDRTGNVGAWTLIGGGTPSYYRLIGGGGGAGSDFDPADPDIVTGNGTAALVYGQTDWATSPLPTARLNYLDNSGNLSGLTRITDRSFNLLTGRTADHLTYLTGGVTVDSLRPGEAGANITESRTAALVSGQTAWATYSALAPATVAGRTANLDHVTGNLSSLANVSSRALSLLTGRTADVINYVGGGGATLEVMRPQEGGANITETRTAALLYGQSRFATAPTLSLADSDIAAPWTALESRPALTQGNALTEDYGMADPAAWLLYSCVFAPIVIGPYGSSIRNNVGVAGSFYGARTVPVDPTKTYMVEGYIYPYSEDGTATSVTYGGVDLQTIYGTTISGDGTYWLYSPAGVVPPYNAMTYYSKVFGAGTSRPIPSNAQKMRVIGLPNYSNEAGTYHFFMGWRIVEVVRIGGNLYRLDGTLATEPQIVTDQGTAALVSGQGYFATQNYADWATRVTGTGRPADNAGTSLVLIPYAAEATVQGNQATKTAGSNGSWGGGVLSRDRFAGSAHCSFRFGSAAGGFGPYMMCGLASAAFDGLYGTINYSLFTEGLPAASSVRVYENGSFVTTVAAVGAWAMTDVWSVEYDGARVQYLQNGVVRHTTYYVAADQVLGFAASLVYYGNVVSDVQVGPGRQASRVGHNTFDDVGGGLISRGGLITSLGTAALIAGQGPGATAAANRVLNDRLENGVRTIGQPDGGTLNVGTFGYGQIQIVLPYGATDTMLSFEVHLYNYNTGTTSRYLIGGYNYSSGPQWINVTAQYMGPRAFARPIKFGYYLGKAYIWIGDVGNEWAYTVVAVRNLLVGYNNQNLVWESGWSVTLNNTDISALVVNAVTVPRAGDQVFGEGLLESNGGAVATRANFRTDQGTAALVAGQTSWATYGGLTPSNVAGQVQYLNTSGRIIDGRGMPLNVASGRGISFSPAYMFSPDGTNPDTKIAVAASTVTLVGGSTLSLPSGTITGLTAETGYSIFRDIINNVYVAISGSTTAYRTSAAQYLYMGVQYTSSVLGTYEPLPPPPPGSGNMAEQAPP